MIDSLVGKIALVVGGVMVLIGSSLDQANLEAGRVTWVSS